MAWDRWDKELIINVSLWETYSSSFVSLVKFGVVSRRGEVSGAFPQWRAKRCFFAVVSPRFGEMSLNLI